MHLQKSNSKPTLIILHKLKLFSWDTLFLEITDNYCRHDNSIMVFKILYFRGVNTKEIHDDVI